MVDCIHVLDMWQPVNSKSFHTKQKEKKLSKKSSEIEVTHWRIECGEQWNIDKFILNVTNAFSLVELQN